MSFFESLEPTGVTSKGRFFPERVCSRLIFDEPPVRPNLMVEFLVNEVISVIALSELSLLVWLPSHGIDLSISGSGDQPWSSCGARMPESVDAKLTDTRSFGFNPVLFYSFLSPGMPLSEVLTQV